MHTRCESPLRAGGTCHAVDVHACVRPSGGSGSGERAPGGRVRIALAGALADAVALLFPVVCAGCAEPGVSLCQSCRGALGPVPQRRVLASGLVVFSGVAFEGVAARVLRALKADGRTALAGALAPALRAALHDALRAARASPGGRAEAPLVVPVPTSAAAMRRRGYRVVEVLARRAGVRPARLLVHVRTVADQRSLSVDARQQNVAGSMRARGVEGRTVVIVDDVATTGATLDEARRALTAAGAYVVAAATVAATPRRVAPHPPAI